MELWGGGGGGGGVRRYLVDPNALSKAVSQFSRLKFYMWSGNNLTMFLATKNCECTPTMGNLFRAVYLRELCDQIWTD